MKLKQYMGDDLSEAGSGLTIGETIKALQKVKNKEVLMTAAGKRGAFTVTEVRMVKGEEGFAKGAFLMLKGSTE
jgi:hypothetical protein